jgi:hypothetical protein
MGITLFLYRVFHNGTIRTPPGRLTQNGKEEKSSMPVELHVLLTSWASSADLQHRLLGWAMRVLEDTPIIPSTILNYNEDVFHPDETIEIVPTELSTENLFRIWETVTDKNYQISVPYVLRIIFIESLIEESSGKPVQQRIF